MPSRLHEQQGHEVGGSYGGMLHATARGGSAGGACGEVARGKDIGTGGGLLPAAARRGSGGSSLRQGRVPDLQHRRAGSAGGCGVAVGVQVEAAAETPAALRKRDERVGS